MFLLVMLLCFQAGKSAAQVQNIKRIPLTWNSFKNTTNPNLPYIAYTAHKTLYKYRATQKGNNVSLKFEVGIMLDTPNTVVNRERLQDLTTSGRLKLLKHEQGHTDLAVIYGRMLYKQLSSQTYTPNNVKTKTREIYLRLMKELAEENRTYDVETEHGFNDEKQQNWAANIAGRI
jgi:hypothetical protein